MKKITVWLLCFCIVYVSSVTAFAQTISQDGTGSSAVISVTVPDSHTLTVSAEHAQVLYGGQWDESFSVERLSEPTLLIRPEDGYKVTRVTLNGEDVTAQVQGGYYTMGPVYEEKTLVVETKAAVTKAAVTTRVAATTIKATTTRVTTVTKAVVTITRAATQSGLSTWAAMIGPAMP